MKARDKLKRISELFCSKCDVKDYTKCESCEFHKLVNELFNEVG